MYQTSLYWPSTRGLRGPFWRQFIWLIQATNVVFAEEGEQVNKLGNFGQTTFYWRLTFSFLSMGKVKICMFWFFVKVFLGRNLWKTGVMASFMVSWYRQSSILMMIGDIDFWKGRTWCMWLYKDATWLTHLQLQVLSCSGQFSLINCREGFSIQLSDPLYHLQCLEVLSPLRISLTFPSTHIFYRVSKKLSVVT